MKFITLIVFVLTVCPCLSQTPKEERNCRLIFLQRSHDAPKIVYLSDGVRSQKAELSSMNFTPRINLAPGNITLSLTEDPVNDIEDTPEGAPSVKIPESLNEFFLIIVSDPTNEVLPIRAIAVNSGDSKLKSGETLWINLTKHRIEGRLGDVPLKVPAGARVVSGAPRNENGYYKARFAYLPNGENEYVPIMNKSWWFDSRCKNLGFILNAGGRLPRIFTFQDQRTSSDSEVAREE